MALAAYPGPSATHGFSCQTWVSRQVNEYLHPRSFHCWFARNLNAMDNGDSSNPALIYLDLDRAVKQGDINKAKIKDVRSNLLDAVSRELVRVGRTSEIPLAIAEISNAPIQMFKPQIWKLDLGVVGARYKPGYQYPDEYLVTDLKDSEFQVIID